MLNWLKYQIRNYFGFSKTETNGFLILSALILLIIFITPFYSLFFQNQVESSLSDKILIDSLAAQLLSETENNKTHLVKAEEVNIKYKNFDPNTASLNELLAVGIPEKAATTIIKYRTKGGNFNTKEDLKKIYSLREDIYMKIYPYIVIENKRQKPVAPNKTVVTETAPNYKPIYKKPQSFDINTADTVQLIAQKGIGSKLAHRIIKYRDALGGFINKEQFKEVYGLNEDAIAALNEFATIAADFRPKLIDVNKADYDQLNKHPYISSQIARTIIVYKKQHGQYKSIEDLKKIVVLDEQQLNKIKPYLNFD